LTANIPIRRRLPNRRPALNRTITADNHCLEVSVGIDPADGQPRKIFLDGTKDGGELAAILDDASVVISVALQHGISAAALAKSVARIPLAPVMPADLAEAAGRSISCASLKPMAHELSPAALKMRRYRHRQRNNLLVAQAWVPLEVAEKLVAAGYLAEFEAGDGRALGKALARLGEDWVSGDLISLRAR
jgi:hypothetical protein